MEEEITVSASFDVILNKILNKLVEDTELVAKFDNIMIKYICDDEQERQIFEITRRVKDD